MKKKIFLIGLLLLTLTAAVACGVEQSASESPKESPSADSELPEDGGEKEEEKEPETGGDGEETDVSYTVTFDSDGGTAVASVEVKKGEKLTEPTAPQKSSAEGEYEFLGWFYGNEEWDFATDTVSGNMTLVAQWKKTDGYTKPFLPKD